MNNRLIQNLRQQASSNKWKSSILSQGGITSRKIEYHELQGDQLEAYQRLLNTLEITYKGAISIDPLGFSPEVASHEEIGILNHRIITVGPFKDYTTGMPFSENISELLSSLWQAGEPMLTAFAYKEGLTGIPESTEGKPELRLTLDTPTESYKRIKDLKDRVMAGILGDNRYWLSEETWQAASQEAKILTELYPNLNAINTPPLFPFARTYEYYSIRRDDSDRYYFKGIKPVEIRSDEDKEQSLEKLADAGLVSIISHGKTPRETATALTPKIDHPVLYDLLARIVSTPLVEMFRWEPDRFWSDFRSQTTPAQEAMLKQLSGEMVSSYQCNPRLTKMIESGYKGIQIKINYT